MKHTIDIEGLPEGWEPVAYRKPIFGEYYFYNDDIVQGKTGCGQFLIVKKKQPRRIVLEETDDFHEPESPEDMHTTIFPIHDCATAKEKKKKKWRIAEDSGENDD